MKLRALLLTTALITFGSVAHAGARQSIGVNVGLAMPTGDLSDAVGMGYLVGAGYEYRINQRFGVGLDVDYFALGAKSTSSTYLGSTRTVKEEAPGGQAILFGRYYLPLKNSPFAPYVSLALEKVRIGFKSTVTYRGRSWTTEDKQDEPGFGVGVGATRPLNRQLTGGLELGLHQIQTSGQSTHLFTIALSCSYNLGK
jgi:outer membrane protein W